MEQWVCELCGYVYDPAKGTEDIEPGVPFESLPEDWECPECLAEKERFTLALLVKNTNKLPKIK